MPVTRFPLGHFFTIGALAELCHRDIASMRRYERVGLIPAPVNRNSRGWRVYSYTETHAIVLAFRKVDAKEIRIADLPEFIRSRHSSKSETGPQGSDSVEPPHNKM